MDEESEYIPLPYVFDLLYDIKTRHQLIAKIAELQVELLELKHLARENGIDISEIDKLTTGE